MVCAKVTFCRFVLYSCISCQDLVGNIKRTELVARKQSTKLANREQKPKMCSKIRYAGSLVVSICALLAALCAKGMWGIFHRGFTSVYTGDMTVIKVQKIMWINAVMMNLVTNR